MKNNTLTKYFAKLKIVPKELASIISLIYGDIDISNSDELINNFNIP